MRGLPVEHDIYVRPDPVRVALLWDDPFSGPEAACERWFWCGSATLSKIAVEGRAILRARKTPGVAVVHKPRSTTAAVDDLIVETVLRIGHVVAAALETGTTRSVVLRVLRERGVPIPSPGRAVGDRLLAEARARRAAA